MKTLCDTAPYPWDVPEAQRLCEMLTQSYSEVSSAQFIARTAGIRLDTWNAQQSSLSAWRDLLDISARQGRLRALVEAVLTDANVAAYHGDIRQLAFYDVSPASRPRQDVPIAPRAILSIETDGDFREFDETKRVRAERDLQQAAMDPSLRIVRIRAGSIIFELEMSGDATDILLRLVESGELKTLLGYTIRRATSTGPNARMAQPQQQNVSIVSTNSVKLLFLAANPIDTARLALDQEVRLISQHLRACRLSRQIQLVQRWAAQPDDILQAMNEERPNVVHFSGHGCKTGELRFVGHNGLSKAVDLPTLRRVFATFREYVRVVVLNACYSSKQARVISGLVDCTIGMSRDITDPAATAFAASFYRAIGFGSTVKEAFEQGVTSICLEGFSTQHRIPRLHFRKDVDPCTIRLCL